MMMCCKNYCVKQLTVGVHDSIKELSVYQQFNSVSIDTILVGILCVFKYNTYIFTGPFHRPF